MQAKRSRRNVQDELFSLAELNWFSRNSYNLAVKVCADWGPHHTLRLVAACLKVCRLHNTIASVSNSAQFLDLYPTDMDPNVLADLSLRRLFCDFLSASLLIVMARGEDSIETQVYRNQSLQLGQALTR